MTQTITSFPIIGKKLSELDALPSAFDGSESINVVKAGVNYRSTSSDLATYVHDTNPYINKQIVYWESEADLPTPVMAPDGVLRHPLEKNTIYVPQYTTASNLIFLTTPFWYPETPEGAETNVEGLTAGFIVTLFADSVHAGYYNGIIRFPRMIFVNGLYPAAVDFYDLEGSITATTLPYETLNNFLVQGFSLGRLRNQTALVFTNAVIVNDTAPLQIHNVNSFIFDTVLRLNLGASSNQPLIVLSGSSTLVTLNTMSLTMQSGESFIAIDESMNAVAINIKDIFYAGEAGTIFFQAALNSSITAFSNLATLISGSVTAYTAETYGAGTVLVTDSAAHSVYRGLKVSHSGTTNYNGTHTVLRIVNTTQYVIDATYVADEVSGTYQAVGSRVTTAAAHNITENRNSNISGTTNYNGLLEVLNPTTTSFDIVTPFVVDDATGAVDTISLDRDDPKVNALGNGKAADSSIFGSFGWANNSTDTVVSTINTWYSIAGTTYPIEMHRASQTANNEVTFTNINAIEGTAEIDLQVLRGAGSGTPIAEVRILKNSSPLQLNGVDIVAKAELDVTNPVPFVRHHPVTIAEGDIFTLEVRNITNTANILVEDGNLIIHK